MDVADVKKMLIQYQTGALPRAKSMLVEAHLHECVDCRRVAEAGNQIARAVTAWTQELPRMDFQRYRWVMRCGGRGVLCFPSLSVARAISLPLPRACAPALFPWRADCIAWEWVTNSRSRPEIEIGENEQVPYREW